MRKNRLLVFFVITFVFNLAASFAHPVTPTLIVERNLDSSMFGVAFAAMMTMNFLFSPFWGRLCSYVSTKKIIFLCSLGYSVGQIIFGTAMSELQVVGGRMFAGIFTGGVYTAMANHVINLTDDRGRDLVWLTTIQNVSSAVGFFVGGMLGIFSVGTAFTAQVILLSLSGLLYLLLCIDDTAYKTKPETPLNVRDVNPFAAFAAVRTFITPALALLFVIVAVSAVGQNSYEQCFNYYIKDQFGLSSAYNGTFKAVIAVLILAANSTICMRLTTRTDVNRTFLPIMCAAAASLGVVLLWNTLPAFVVVYVLFSVLNSMRMPLFQNMTSMRATPENSNAVMGFYQSMGSLGGIFGALFAGLIYDINVRLPFILAFIAYSCAAALSALYVKRYNRERVK